MIEGPIAGNEIVSEAGERGDKLNLIRRPAVYGHIFIRPREHFGQKFLVRIGAGKKSKCTAPNGKIPQTIAKSLFFRHLMHEAVPPKSVPKFQPYGTLTLRGRTLEICRVKLHRQSVFSDPRQESARNPQKSGGRTGRRREIDRLISRRVIVYRQPLKLARRLFEKLPHGAKFMLVREVIHIIFCTDIDALRSAVQRPLHKLRQC